MTNNEVIGTKVYFNKKEIGEISAVAVRKENKFVQISQHTELIETGKVLITFALSFTLFSIHLYQIFLSSLELKNLPALSLRK